MIRINETIQQFDRMSVMHSWLRDRHMKGGHMPQTQAECQLLIQTDMAKGKANTGEAKEMQKKMKKTAMKSSNRRMGKGR